MSETREGGSERAQLVAGDERGKARPGPVDQLISLRNSTFWVCHSTQLARRQPLFVGRSERLARNSKFWIVLVALFARKLRVLGQSFRAGRSELVVPSGSFRAGRSERLLCSCVGACGRRLTCKSTMKLLLSHESWSVATGDSCPALLVGFHSQSSPNTGQSAIACWRIGRDVGNVDESISVMTSEGRVATVTLG